MKISQNFLAFSEYMNFKHSHLRLSSFVKKPNPIDCNDFSQYLKLLRRHLIHIEEFCPHPDTVDQKFCQLQMNTIGEKWIIWESFNIASGSYLNPYDHTKYVKWIF